MAERSPEQIEKSAQAIAQFMYTLGRLTKIDPEEAAQAAHAWGKLMRTPQNPKSPVKDEENKQK